jgi:prepilin-type N-terminal cleavage/methylation domain-containing protein
MSAARTLRFYEGGFTLIELLVAIAVITILTAFTIPAFTSFQKSQTLAQTTQRLKDDLRLAQSKALSAVAVEGEARAWGVHFTDGANTYYFFSCTPDSSRYDEYRRGSPRCQDFASTRLEASGIVIYTNGPAESDLAFEVLSGFVIRDGMLLSGETTLRVGFTDGSLTQTITIGQGGSIR